jgi:hypothetical protein
MEFPLTYALHDSAEWVKDRLLTSLQCKLLDPFLESIPIPPRDTKASRILNMELVYSYTHCPVVSKREETIKSLSC